MSDGGLVEYRKRVKNALVMVYSDLEEVIKALNERGIASDNFPPDVKQKLATTILIDYLKRSQ